MSIVEGLATSAPSSAETLKNAKFPVAPYHDAGSYFGDYARELARAASAMEPAAFDRAASLSMATFFA